jgi:hypothetical protein
MKYLKYVIGIIFLGVIIWALKGIVVDGDNIKQSNDWGIVRDNPIVKFR